MEVVRIDTVEIQSEREPGSLLLEVIAYTMMSNNPLVISSGNTRTTTAKMHAQEFHLMEEISRALLGLGFTSAEIKKAKRKRIQVKGADSYLDTKNELLLIENQGLQVIRFLLDKDNIVPSAANF